MLKEMEIAFGEQYHTNTRRMKITIKYSKTSIQNTKNIIQISINILTQSSKKLKQIIYKIKQEGVWANYEFVKIASDTLQKKNHFI